MMFGPSGGGAAAGLASIVQDTIYSKSISEFTIIMDNTKHIFLHDVENLELKPT